jgi:LysR family transcriptional regulator, cyn operon transcriptional activator
MIPEFNGDFLQWLRGFYYTAQTGSMTAATPIMNRNQSALAHQIKCLEQEFGVKLFCGNKTKRVLTDEGRYLLEKSIYIFEMISNVRKTITALPDTLTGEIGIAAAYTAVQYYLPNIVALFGSNYPKVCFRFFGHASRQAILDMVTSRTADIAILCTESAPAEFHVTPLFRTEVMCVSPKTGPYAVYDVSNLEYLAHLPCFFPPESSTMEPFLDIQFNRYGLKLRTCHEVNHFEAAKMYVRLGMGITFVDKFACSEADFDQLNIQSLSHFFPPRVFSVVRRLNMFIPPHLDAFLKYLTSKKVDELHNSSVGLKAVTEREAV